MLKKEIIRKINKTNSPIFNFYILNETLDNLPQYNYQIIPLNGENINNYERIDIKYTNSQIASVSIEYLTSNPNMEIIFIKKYDNQNIMQEEINFCCSKYKEEDEENFCVNSYKLSRNENCFNIINSINYYMNEKNISTSSNIISITEFNFYKYFNELIIPFIPNSIGIGYGYDEDKINEFEEKSVTLSRIYQYANEENNKRKNK